MLLMLKYKWYVGCNAETNEDNYFAIAKCGGDFGVWNFDCKCNWF